MKNLSSRLTGGAIALALCLSGMATVAQASVISGNPDTSFSNGSYQLNFANGAATYTLADTGDLFNAVSVQTGGTGLVASVFGQPSAYFTDSRAPFIDGNLLANFQSYDTPTTIPFSGTDSYLALAFNLADGIHYGYARVAGAFIDSFGYETVAGRGIQAGAVADVPEPSALGLSLFALALIGSAAVVRKRRQG